MTMPPAPTPEPENAELDLARRMRVQLQVVMAEVARGLDILNVELERHRDIRKAKDSEVEPS